MGPANVYWFVVVYINLQLSSKRQWWLGRQSGGQKAENYVHGDKIESAFNAK